MTDGVATSATASARGSLAGLAPLVVVTFLAFMAIGAPLAALSLYVHDELGFSTLTVGIAVGLQSVATVASRHWGGTLSDRHGPRRAVLLGLPLATLAGLLYLLATIVPLAPAGKLAILLSGRVVLGLGESLFATGAMSWGIGRLGAARTGLVMSWQGIAMYAAFGGGAPLGLAVMKTFGFAGVGILTAVMPLIGMAIVLGLPGTPATGGERVAFHRVLGAIWRFGLVQTLASVPFAAMAAFLPLDYAARGWSGAGLAITAFGATYVVARLAGASLPDRFGGAAVVTVCVIIEAVGQIVLWLAPSPAIALLGAALTGVGYSLVFPSMGVMATRQLPPEQRGRAVANFIAFFDLSIGLTAPIVGVVTGRFGYASAFLVGAMALVGACAVVASIRREADGAPVAKRAAIR